MKNKILLIGLVLMTLVVKQSRALEKGQPDDKKPNILFILVDDWGWTDLGVAGSKYYETPNIDKLASEGLRFTQAYSVGPNCAPSRASLMTGKYTPRHGIFTVSNSDRGESSQRKLIPIENNTVLNPSFVTIAEELKNAGYNTGLIGKWQLGGKNKGADAQAQGFDHVIGGSPGTPSYFYPYSKDGDKSPHEGIETGEEGEYLTDRLTDEAIRFIDSNKQKPFFLYLSYFAVHTPIQAKEPVVQKYKGKKGDQYHNNPTYAAMIESADEGIGRVLKSLETLHLAENTFVVFFSDNGGMGAVTAQPPLRGSKGMLYEGGVRVPLIIKWPGKTKAGSKTETPVIGIDFYPSLLEIANIQKPLNGELDGQSFVPLLLGKTTPARDIFWHFPAYLEGYKGDKRHKDTFRTRPTSVVRSGDFKLHQFYEDGRVELYNIKADIGEWVDLSRKNPAKTKELLSKLEAWKTAVNAPVPTQPNPDFVPVTTGK
ncbi:N-acetylgalactosamine-6-O-sulfatase [Dyadobacter sp. CECT 9275]|uniref:N-acetylgalactosamine-6-O-sulfatase n=1 Tax=Dyadobacter helix TaxID=2822344 RepID=A0A916NKC8_9BACT|nr:sulfatase [Dyadobacter sp. CECT 9275]CAG4994107.1 N-acetylgalactosamine-6-O-sulfatase [Dyadobacter sp. CECT 9275]